MKPIYKPIFLSYMVLGPLLTPAADGVKAVGVETRMDGDSLSIGADIVLDSLSLGANRQILVTPVVRRDTLSAEFPSILISGRNMHIIYLRGALRNAAMVKDHEIAFETQRRNGTPQTVSYAGSIPLEKWMRSSSARLEFIYDECGCGTINGTAAGAAYAIYHNPAPRMCADMIVPPVMELPVRKHEGRARVQFEVDRTELHVAPYICRNGQRIDNRAQIAIIDDSVSYALAEPDVELAGISICGYASPESPYTRNARLATERSRALAEYLEERYNLPQGSVEYSAVAENWREFRDEVERSNEITDEQRRALLELIDAPASTPEDFDLKEQTLKSDPRFARLYKTKILPEWFPRLRATTFEIRTRLKPVSVEIPDEKTLLINAAAACIGEGDYAKARELALKAGDSPEAFNILGIVATAEEDFDLAREYFGKAGSLQSAQENLHLLE